MFADEEDAFATVTESDALLRFEHSFATDGKLAIGVRGINCDYGWKTTDRATGQQQEHCGCALYVALMNRMRKPITDLHLGNSSYLIDDAGHQYSPCDSSYYWVDEDTGTFNSHGDFLAPRSKVDGLILFPALRSSSIRFVRYVIYGAFQVGDDIGTYKKRYYDIKLQKRKRSR